MNTKPFNPADWLPKPPVITPGLNKDCRPEPALSLSKGEGQNPKTLNPQHPTHNPQQTLNNELSTIEPYIQIIEQSQSDLTTDYPTWRDLGFALSEEFGENGRDYFHRISKFYSGYNSKECDQQFTNCLKAKGSGITIATFYHHFFNAGLRLPTNTTSRIPSGNPVNNQEDSDLQEEAMPVFPIQIFNHLPDFLQKVVSPANSPEERDILLLGAITSLSACFPKLYGIYDGKKVFSNLYLFVTAPASAGKGRLSLCKKLVLPIHKNLREQARLLKLQYASELAEFNMEKNPSKEKPGKPPERMLFIPANNSTTGVFQLLSDNKGHGLIFETEGDTLAQSFKSDYGNYSDGFRKAFHHETISYYRRTDREYVDIDSPCLSTVLSGTPKQITSLIPSAENGLFSRFIFYYMNLQPVWKNVFEIDDTEGMDAYYLNLGGEFLDLYSSLMQSQPIRISLSPHQQQAFNHYFSNLQTRYLNLEEEEYIATIRRLGLIAFRICIIFSALRIMEDGELSPVREVEDRDFDSVLSIIGVLVQHASRLFSHLPEEAPLTRRLNRKDRFMQKLPYTFGRPDYLKAAESLQIPPKTAEKYITQFVKAGLLHRDSFGSYLNPSKTQKAEIGEMEKPGENKQ